MVNVLKNNWISVAIILITIVISFFLYTQLPTTISLFLGKSVIFSVLSVKLILIYPLFISFSFFMNAKWRYKLVADDQSAASLLELSKKQTLVYITSVSALYLIYLIAAAFPPYIDGMMRLSAIICCLLFISFGNRMGKIEKFSNNFLRKYFLDEPQYNRWCRSYGKIMVLTGIISLILASIDSELWVYSLVLGIIPGGLLSLLQTYLVGRRYSTSSSR